jgi:hypothetical protein
MLVLSKGPNRVGVFPLSPEDEKRSSFRNVVFSCDRLCDLVVRVLSYRSGGLGSIPGTTSKKKSSGSGTGSTEPREYN